MSSGDSGSPPVLRHVGGNRGQLRTVGSAAPPSVGNGGFRGTVVDQAGRPLAGAFVDTDVDVTVGFGAPPYIYAETAADGTYRARGLAPGTHHSCVSKPGYTAVCDQVTYPYTVTITEAATTRVPPSRSG